MRKSDIQNGCYSNTYARNNKYIWIFKYIVCKIKSDNHISIQIRVNAGSRDEKNNILGISHLLEHMFFQGSEKYPTQKDLESAIYECGGSFNAYTSKSSTVFYIDASKKCLESI